MEISKTITSPINRKKLLVELQASTPSTYLDTITTITSRGEEYSFTFSADAQHQTTVNTNLDSLISSHTTTPLPLALIYDYIEDHQTPQSTDATIIGLFKCQWAIKKGRREQREYKENNQPTSKTVVRDSYSYTFVEDSQGNPTMQIESYTRVLDWLMDDGSISFSKTLSTQQSEGYINRINREIRQGQMDKLMQDGNQLRIDANNLDPNSFPTQEDYEAMRDGFIYVANQLDLLWLHYETQIIHHISLGGSELWDAVDGETDSSILAILGIVVDQTTQRTVKDNIEYQITGYEPT